MRLLERTEMVLLGGSALEGMRARWQVQLEAARTDLGLGAEQKSHGPQQQAKAERFRGL